MGEGGKLSVSSSGLETVGDGVGVGVAVLRERERRLCAMVAD